MVRQVVTLAIALSLATVSGCGSSLVSLGKNYEAQGDVATAMAYYAKSLDKRSSNSEAQVAWSLGYQQLARTHRLEIERLRRNGLALQALGRLIRLEELSIYAQKRNAAADEPGAFAEERDTLTDEARTQIAEAEDARRERGTLVFSDVVLCRQGAALTPGGEDQLAHCDQLAEGFRHYVKVTGDPSGAAPSSVLQGVVEALKARNMDRIQLAQSGDHTALVEVYTATPELHETPWYIVARTSHRKWIPKKDKKGRQKTRVTVIPPTQQALKAAAKAKQPAPKPKKITKKLWELVTAESRQYRMDRRLTQPWSARLRDLREGDERLVGGTSGVITLATSSTYGECSGDQRACPSITPRDRAKPLATPEQLQAKALSGVGPKTLTWIYEALD